MRNLKKILALVLALVMSMSLMATANAFTDDADITAKYDEAVEVLDGIGVFKGYANADGTYTFNPKALISREEVAAVMYRIASGDVKDLQDALYVEGADFTDVKATAWSAGYIGYCANGNIIVGNGDGTFGPKANVTGYQVLAMALRAIGYDKNGEFTGADWAKNVATTAQSLGILKNVPGTVQLSKPATRELVAELIFQTIAIAPMVEYTPAFGYQPVKVLFGTATTLGYEQFLLRKVEGLNDVWGRPYHNWVKDGTATVYASIEETPIAKYNTAVAECQIAADYGLSTSSLQPTKTVDLYVNGKTNKTNYIVQATDTIQKIGGQGVQVEIYKDEIVVISTFLAKVDKVTPAVYDAAGHKIANARIDLYIYDGNNEATKLYDTKATGEYAYAAGDYILVNAYTNNSPNATTGAVVVNYVADTSNDVDYMEIVGKAETLVGAQTFLWYNALQHTVNGTNYYDAAEFHLDQAGVETSNHTWFFDSFGNLIGAADIATQYSFGIVENIQWQNPALAVGYAQATIRYMDGTTETKVVTAIDGQPLTYAIGNNNGDFASGSISTTMQNNLSQCGDHLYRIATAADGTISLNHVFVDADNDGVQDGNEADSEIQTADVKTGISAITNGSATVYTNSNTQYLIRTDVKNAQGTVIGYTYATVTGYENIGKYTGTDVVVDFVNLNNDSYVDYVYITGTADSASAWGLFFPTSSTIQTVLKTAGTVDHYLVTGYADGAAATVKVNPTNTNGSFGTDVTAAELASMVNKMYVVHYTNGVIDQIWGNKTDVADLHNEICSGANAAYAGTALEYYAGTGETVTYDGFALKVGSAAPINVVGVTPVVGEWAADLSNKVIHVVYNKTTTKALQVYITNVAGNGQNSGTGIPATPSTLTLTQSGAQINATYTNNSGAAQAVKVVYQYKVSGAAGGYATFTSGNTWTVANSASESWQSSTEALTLPTGGYQVYEVIATAYVGTTAVATATQNFMN